MAAVFIKLLQQPRINGRMEQAKVPEVDIPESLWIGYATWLLPSQEMRWQ